jgi:asparagine synthase (glutamine-hydrolysing)
MIEEVRERLLDAVRVRLRADVPVGIYLSGGLDSSAVVGMIKHLMEKEGTMLGSQKTDLINCFSIKFLDDAFDEARKWLFKILHHETECAYNPSYCTSYRRLAWGQDAHGLYDRRDLRRPF